MGIEKSTAAEVAAKIRNETDEYRRRIIYEDFVVVQTFTRQGEKYRRTQLEKLGIVQEGKRVIDNGNI